MTFSRRYFLNIIQILFVITFHVSCAVAEFNPKSREVKNDVTVQGPTEVSQKKISESSTKKSDSAIGTVEKIESIESIEAKRASLGQKKSTDKLLDLKKVFNQFWLSDAVTMKLNKVVEAGLFDQKTKYFGTFFFSKGRIRVEFIKPKKSLLVVDDNNIWHAVKLPEDLGGQWQVTKMKKSMTNKAQAFLNLMFGDELYWKKLKILKIDFNKNVKTYVFKPKSENDFPNLKTLKISVDIKKQELKSIIQWDHVENKTTYYFSIPDLKTLVPKKHFSFKVPKGATLNEF